MINENRKFLILLLCFLNFQYTLFIKNLKFWNLNSEYTVGAPYFVISENRS